MDPITAQAHLRARSPSSLVTMMAVSVYTALRSLQLILYQSDSHIQYIYGGVTENRLKGRGLASEPNLHQCRPVSTKERLRPDWLNGAQGQRFPSTSNKSPLPLKNYTGQPFHHQLAIRCNDHHFEIMARKSDAMRTPEITKASQSF